MKQVSEWNVLSLDVGNYFYDGRIYVTWTEPVSHLVQGCHLDSMLQNYNNYVRRYRRSKNFGRVGVWISFQFDNITSIYQQIFQPATSHSIMSIQVLRKVSRCIIPSPKVSHPAFGGCIICNAFVIAVIECKHERKTNCVSVKCAKFIHAQTSNKFCEIIENSCYL